MSSDTPTLSPTRYITAVLPFGGGLAKSEVTMVEAALHALAGHRTLLVEADPGLPLLTNCLDPARYDVLSMPAVTDPDYGESLFRRAVEDDARCVAIDVGGNALLDRHILHNLRVSLAHFREQGWDARLKVIMRPGKEGLAVEVGRLARAFEPLADIHLVAVDIDGSGDFSSFELVAGMYPTHHLPYIEPALLALVRGCRGLASDLIIAPPPGFSRAAGWIARTLASFARSNGFGSTIGCGAALRVLDEAAGQAPERSFAARRRRWQVADITLAADEEAILAQEAFIAFAAGTTSVDFANATLRYHEALHARRETYDRARELYGD